MAMEAASLPGLAPGMPVRIAIPGHERASACVTHVTATWLGLRIVGVGGVRPNGLAGCRGGVEFMDGLGLPRVRGEVALGDGSSAGGVRFVLRGGSGPQFLGRRE